MSCEECTGRVGDPYWVIQYGYRPGREPEGPIRNLVHPKAFHVCDACVAKIPDADRKPDHGRLGLKSGRIAFLNRYTETYVGGHMARSDTSAVRGNKTAFLSVSLLRRRLPKLMAKMEKADRLRMKRGKEEVRRKKKHRG